MTGPRIGEPAPDFDLPSDGGGRVRLADFSGRKLVLYFYPSDDTQTCTAEAIAFSSKKADFEATGATVIGVSPDSAALHDKFKKKHSLAVSLGADETRVTIERYGVWREKSMFGHRYMGVVRSTFLIGRDGRIARIWENVRLAGHVEAVLAAARAMP
jgi:peroxiredoxin Q/BCP